MTKVITYGTYDLLHYGHVRLLERAKALGDYLIVGVTADGFDKARGKINVQQSLMERIEAVKETGLADQIIIEEYEGQKIDDIKKYGVDIFTVGSDWVGKFDYLNEYCKVVYLDRTQGVSSTELRAKQSELRIGIIGETNIVNKFRNECDFVNGVKVIGIYAADKSMLDEKSLSLTQDIDSISTLIERCDAVYIASLPKLHYSHTKNALVSGKHVLCESPISHSVVEYEELSQIAADSSLILMDGIKTAYSLAFDRMMLLLKGGIIGEVISVDTTCTSLVDFNNDKISLGFLWNSLNWWGPTAMLPIFDIFGTDYKSLQISSKSLPNNPDFDIFTKCSFVYENGVASFKVGQGVKSEGEMIISGTNGYIYVPAPWWKTDFFEVRYENPTDNKRYFYQLDGEGIRYEILSFLHQIEGYTSANHISSEVSRGIIDVIERSKNDHINLL